MSRIIVAAVSGESKFIDIAYQLELFVTVCDAASGAPISGLTADHFRACAPSGSLFDITIGACVESTWDTQSGEGSGCYSLSVSLSQGADAQPIPWLEGEFYPLGIQVRYADQNGDTHTGQTVVRVQSLGK
jgi:hypothetical protein